MTSRSAVCLMVGLLASGSALVSALQKVPLPSKDPFQNDNGLKPTPQQYRGPMFRMEHAWPTAAPPPLTNPPWVQAIGGVPIDKSNAKPYVLRLKQYVSANAKQLILNYAQWDAAKARWFNEPWLGSKREAIHGTYAAGNFTKETFPGTGLTTSFNTYALTYYDERAAYTLNSFWTAGAMTPSFTTANAQFPEGSIILKVALFASDDPAKQRGWWTASAGAAEWPLFVPLPQATGKPMVATGYAMQFDIIVKDSHSSPKTGWVFSTLVFDAGASGDAWDKMVPLGAMWGNDPEVNSATSPDAPLMETWINPEAPIYSTQTLGWGNRLSGPNDGARNNIQVDEKVMLGAANSSCMSCHGPSEWNQTTHKMQSFLMPSFPNTDPTTPKQRFKSCGKEKQYICSPAPGSAEWMRWFQDRPGSIPQDSGSIALDYDEVFAFKGLTLWWDAVGPPGQPMPSLARPGLLRYNEYTGAPIPRGQK